MVDRRILQGELIGHEIKFRDEKIGKIIDETKNTIVIMLTNGEKKKLLKKNNVFEIMFDNKFMKINGNLLLMRSEERIKIR